MVVEGIRSLLQQDKEIELVGSASSVASCKAFLKQLQPDVILLDINLPDGSGLDLCAEIRTQYPTISILGLSTFNQGSYIKKMMENGASGYILKNASQKELTEAIHEVSHGRTYLAFDVAKTLQAEEKKVSHEIMISRREKEVLNLLKEGFTNGEIGEQMDIAESTVATYRKSLLSKLNAKNTADLIHLAFRYNLITIS